MAKKPAAVNHHQLIAKALATGDAAELEASLADVPLATLVSFVLQAWEPEVRSRLVARFGRAPSLLPAALAGLATNDETQLVLDDPAWSADLGGLTPAHIAAMCGASRCLGSMREAGVACDELRQVGWERHTPLSVAIHMEHWALAEALLDAGADPKRVSAVVGSVVRVPDPLLVRLVAAMGPAHVAGGAIFYAGRLTEARFERLVELGMPVTNGFVVSVLKGMNLTHGDDAERERVTRSILSRAQVGDGLVDVDGAPVDLVHLALEGSQERAEVLRAAGCPVRKLNIPRDWGDGESKQAWVDQHAVPSGSAFADFITSRAGQVSERVVSAVAGPGSVGPVRLGMTKAEAIEAVGTSPAPHHSTTHMTFHPGEPDYEEGGYAEPYHQLEVTMEDEVVTRVRYAWDQAGPDTLYKSMLAEATRVFGKPLLKEKKLVRWALGDGEVELRLNGKRSWELESYSS